MRCMRGYIPASRVQFKSLGGGGGRGPSTGLQCHIEGPYRISGWSPVPHEAPRVVLEGLYRRSGCR